jgi:small GTP-binding protein
MFTNFDYSLIKRANSISFFCNFCEKDWNYKNDKRMEKYKVILVGDSSVGKSSLIYRLNRGEFREDITSTIGMAYSVEKLWVGDELIGLEINDTAGQERFLSIVPMYFKGAQGVIFVYDMNNVMSYNNLKKIWFPIFWENYNRRHKPPIIALVGNKSDLVPDDQDAYFTHQMRSLAEEFDLPVLTFFTSAKNGMNVQQCFSKLAEKIHQFHDPRPISSIYLYPNDPEKVSPKKTCC